MFQNKWKLTAISLALVIVLLASCFVILYKPQAAEAKEPVLLDVSIEGKAKLNVDEFSNYNVNVVGGVGELSYDWSFTPVDGKARFYDNGATATIIFKNATEEPYLLEVKVYDEIGNFGVASMVVYDPPTFPSTYLGVYGAPYSYMIKADGTGWYYAINGSTGAVDYTSTNITYIEETVCNILTISGGTIYLKNILFNSSIASSQNTLIIQDYQGALTYYGNTIPMITKTYSYTELADHIVSIPVPLTSCYTLIINDTLITSGAWSYTIKPYFVSSVTNRAYYSLFFSMEYPNGLGFGNVMDQGGNIGAIGSLEYIPYNSGPFNVTISGDLCDITTDVGSYPHVILTTAYGFQNATSTLNINDIDVAGSENLTGGSLTITVVFYSPILGTGALPFTYW